MSINLIRGIRAFAWQQRWVLSVDIRLNGSALNGTELEAILRTTHTIKLTAMNMTKQQPCA